jgi:hypothetical protein
VTGVIGIAFWPVALVGAIRLANPDSWWAHRWYSEGSRRGRRAHKRFSVRREERWNRLRDLIAGAPQIAAGKLAGAQNARPDDHADAPDPPSPELLPEQDLAESVSVDRAKAGPSGVRGPKG